MTRIQFSKYAIYYAKYYTLLFQLLVSQLSVIRLFPLKLLHDININLSNSRGHCVVVLEQDTFILA